MYTITVKGLAKTSYKNKEELNGIDCQDEFSEYFDDDFTFKNDVSNGWMNFRYENDKLWTYTTYQSTRELTKEELAILEDYTTGQWSDGIGEGFEQNACFYTDDDKEVFISPWSANQKTTITQELQTQTA
jgi:hypothetical protein